MKIEKITVYRTNLIPNSGQEEYVFTESSFDPEAGLVLQETRYTPDGQVEEVSKREYDQKGNLTLLVVTDGHGSPLEKRTFEQNPKGHTAREFIHYADNSADRVENTHDENGHLIKRELFDDSDDLETIEVFEYQGDNLIRESELDADGNLLKERLMNYSEKGLLMQERVVDNESDLKLKKVFSYNSIGKVEEVMTFDDQGKALERATYSYDEKGLPFKITEETRTHKNTTTIGYNSKGDVILEEEIDFNGQLVRKIDREIDGNGLLTFTKILTRNPAYGLTISYLLRNEYSIKS